MGKAARWFKGLFGVKKEKGRENEKAKEPICNVESSDSVNGDTRFSSGGKSGKDGDFISEIQQNIPPEDPAWLRSYLAESQKEQNKHAIAVAAATAAAADAAFVAAQAAAAVVILTSNGRGALVSGTVGRERRAAVKIQTVFRGYLARKALRALKGLVKLQALMRGYLVRKRAAATLQSMQALIRAQYAVRSQRLNRSLNYKEIKMFPLRQSTERFVDDPRSEIHSKRLSASFQPTTTNSYEESSPKIVEIDTYKPRLRSRRMTKIASSECGDDFLYQGKDFEWCFTGDKCKFSTAHSTPRFSNSADFYTPRSPAKSVCGDGCFRTDYGINSPNYMVNTQSSKAKLRSQSAPRKRMEKKRLSLDETMAARNSISCARMRRSSCSYYQFEEATTRY